MKVVIMAGGKGTRIASVASDIPKPMIQIQEDRFLNMKLFVLESRDLQIF